MLAGVATALADPEPPVCRAAVESGLVLGSRAGRTRFARVLLDGRAIPDRLAGRDVHSGTLRIRAQRLYRLVDLPRVERHRLTLELAPGISGYAFTFG